MTQMEINARKAELVKSILNDIESEDVLYELELLVEKLTVGDYPCMYSIEEVQAAADDARKAYKEGDQQQFVSHEEMKKRHFV